MQTETITAAPLVRQINAEWAERTGPCYRDYGTLGFRTGDDLVRVLRTGCVDEQDATVHALLTLAQAGHAHAERVLLQEVVRVARGMARRVRMLDDMRSSDRVGVAISAGWEAMHTYPLHLRERVLANLHMRMLSVLSPKLTANDRVIASRTSPWDDEALDDVAPTVPGQLEPPVELQLADLFTWAIDTRVLDRSEVALLVRTAIDEAPRAVVAAEAGLTVDSLRTKVRRIRTRLTVAAVTAYPLAA